MSDAAPPAAVGAESHGKPKGKNPNTRRNQIIVGGTLALVVLAYLQLKKTSTPALTAQAPTTPGGIDTGGGTGGSAGGIAGILPPLPAIPGLPVAAKPAAVKAVAKKPAAVAGKSYTVQSGNTLTSIAQKFGVNLGALEAANAPAIKADAQAHGFTSDYNHWIFSGEKLVIPGKGTVPAPKLKTAAPATHASGPAAVAHPSDQTNASHILADKKSVANIGAQPLPAKP